MNPIKIAILDCIGLDYDGTTLTKRGIGGSESSIISIAPELVKLGFEVSVFNDCASAETSPGVYDGVTYRPISALALEDYKFDIVISQRTVIPFAPEHLYDQVRQPAPRDYDPAWFKQLQRPSQLKILWQADTFIWGDHILEELVVNHYIDEIFNLSDWHIAYTANSTHGPRRNFEVLKGRIFNTRNAINRWIDWVDIRAKDPDLFVYNASITKGMEPLVRDIWPKIKSQCPQAKLKIIGGYYNFRDEAVNEAEAKLIALQALTKDDASIEFTGIIPQPEIAEIMANASYFLYPGAYPETSGISTLESINYNTPVIGVRFGAMEESATDAAGYFINYAIEPNGLFPWINQDHQVARYVSLVSRVVNNPYLHQQKQYACDAVKDVSTWDTVALQWKQHFYNKLGLELDTVEQQRVDWINYRVRKVFGRRIANTEDIIVPESAVDHTPLPQPKLTIAYIDLVGMAYDGDTLNRRGLGGSESAVILSAQEMAKLGFDVSVFNACDEDDNRPGVYNNVQYRPLHELGTDTYDIVISSRCVYPFITENIYSYPQTSDRKFDYNIFKQIRENARLKVFWMHDTFCWGDDILEDLVVSKAIDEIWTLSDFHSMYIMNCSHPRMRSYEVLRNHVWTTRNGIVKYFDSVDLDAKDPNMFIFNANMSKGLQPLLDLVWPRVTAKLPNARLTVIGGYYKLGAAFADDDQESEFMKIAGAHLDNDTITFTGIIKQSQVAEISAKASYFIYPAALPETYSISTLESLYANTPLLTCRFGALEETASRHSYYIDYASVPNGLFPNINPETQADLFADMVVTAYNNPAEHRARMTALEEVKKLAGWEVVALEWKHHIYTKLGLYLSSSESRQVQYTKAKYHQVFGRRYTAPEDVLAPKLTAEQKIVVISPFYNAQNYIEQCIASVAAQDYTNYEHWLIDDASSDSTIKVAEEYIANLPADVQAKFKLIRNNQNQGAGYNYVQAIRGQSADTIVIMLDGDDSLVNRPDIFDYYNKLHLDYDFTYGSCWSVVDNIPLQAQTYPPSIKSAKKYKDHKFNWNLPYTHLRTLKAKLLQGISDSNFQDADGNWFKAGNDLALFYTAIASADPSRVYAVSDIVCNYNDASPINDYKINGDEQNRAVAAVLANPTARPMKRILIAIPTNKNIEAQTFKSIYDLITPRGCIVEFQYFWGYQVDQVRNLIADWTIRNGFDYLFSVDSDIAFAPDTLVKLMAHDRDIVSGVYIQRIPGTHTIEIMRKNPQGGVTHVDWEDIKGQGLVPIDGCGFGCVLINAEVLRAIPYPHFVYHSAIDHANTISEDVHFCNQARDQGFTLWCDTDIQCEHIGSWSFKIDNNIPARVIESPATSVFRGNPEQTRLRQLGEQDLLPQNHFNYLLRMRDEMNIQPRVIYDIGACVLHWTKRARMVWPNADYTVFEAMEASEFLFQEAGLKYNIGLLSKDDGIEVDFYENTEHPGGNSYYRENEVFSPAAAVLFDEAHRKVKLTNSLDTVIAHRGFPAPDFIKMDVQGAELDVLLGAQNTLKTVQTLVLELQHVRYNTGAPLCDEVIAYLDTIGFKLITPLFSNNSGGDGDYHFARYKYF